VSVEVKTGCGYGATFIEACCRQPPIAAVPGVHWLLQGDGSMSNNSHRQLDYLRRLCTNLFEDRESLVWLLVCLNSYRSYRECLYSV